jgi:hypothetical protein
VLDRKHTPLLLQFQIATQNSHEAKPKEFGNFETGEGAYLKKQREKVDVGS